MESGVIHSIISNRSGSCKFGKEFILTNMSCDTIYLLEQDKTLTPLFVQSPTVFSDPPLVTSVGMKTDDFMTFCVYPYDLKKIRREYESGNKQNGSNGGLKFLMYEIKNGQFFELEKYKYWDEKIDVPANTSVELLSPYIMKIWLKQGYLKGELKEIATKVNATDNPVVKIAKFK